MTTRFATHVFRKPARRSAGWAQPLAAVLLGMLISLGGATAAAAAATAPTKTAASPTSAARTVALGIQGMELKGLHNLGYFDFGVRRDEVVTRARLKLRMTYSPSLLPELSHLRVALNDQLVSVIALPKEQAGRDMEQIVDIDPRLITDYNQLRLDLVGHYTLQCEDMSHTSVWLNIARQSALELTTQPLELRNDLSLLPAPFFDRRSNQRLVLPVMLPAQPSLDTLKAAGVAASWFGMLADYRSARFPVSATLPMQHALVFATNAAQPAALQLKPVAEPTLLMMDNPQDRHLKLLVFQGKDEAQLQQAVSALVIGNPVFSGERVTVRGVSIAPREAYDVPRWLHGDRPVKLGELVDSPAQLQTYGISPGPVTINLRLAPDLFTWNRPSVPVNLRYRYTAPKEIDNSLLNISINQQLLRSFRLKPDGESGSLRVPLLANSFTQQREDLLLPALQLSGNNQLQFQFALDYHHDGLCRDVFNDASRQAIDPDSTIDISGFEHYTALPNLALFANAGYPFTRYADLSQTTVVMPDTQPATIEQLLFVLGRMGRHTGAVASQFTLLSASQVTQATQVDNRDLLLLAGAGTQTLLNEWQRTPALQLKGSERIWNDPAPAHANTIDPLRLLGSSHSDNSTTLNMNGSLATLVSFESPRSAGRTVVALTATDEVAGHSLLDALEDDGKIAAMRGDVVIVRQSEVQSYQGSDTYYVGSLRWWTWLWFHISRHPLLLTLLTLALAVSAALLLYGWLQRRHRQRTPAVEPASQSASQPTSQS